MPAATDSSGKAALISGAAAAARFCAEPFSSKAGFLGYKAYRARRQTGFARDEAKLLRQQAESLTDVRESRRHITQTRGSKAEPISYEARFFSYKANLARDPAGFVGHEAKRLRH